MLRIALQGGVIAGLGLGKPPQIFEYHPKVVVDVGAAGIQREGAAVAGDRLGVLALLVEDLADGGEDRSEPRARLAVQFFQAGEGAAQRTRLTTVWPLL